MTCLSLMIRLECVQTAEMYIQTMVIGIDALNAIALKANHSQFHPKCKTLIPSTEKKQVEESTDYETEPKMIIIK